MGLIKTAMMSGAAMYGVNQLAKTAQNRNSNPAPAPRREYNNRDYDSYHSRPQEYRERDSRDQRNIHSEDIHERTFDGGSRQHRAYLEDEQYSARYEPYYHMPAQYDSLPHSESREYASNMRSPSAPMQYYSNQRRAQGFVEPEELMDDSRGGQGGSKADVINMLAQGVVGMGAGRGKGKKEKDSKADLLSSLMSK